MVSWSSPKALFQVQVLTALPVMKIIFLGTNGWYTTQTGNTACILIDSKDYYIVLDCGNGIYKLDQYITEEKPIYLFISHFHIDHVSGFHTLNKFTFPQGLNVCLPKGRRKDFDTLVSPPYSVPPENLKMKIILHELSEGEHHLPSLHLGGEAMLSAGAHLRGEPSFLVEVIEQFHTYKGHGYRFELEGKTIAYSGDSGISDASNKLAKSADLLIHECSYLTDHPKDTWGHVGPIEAATLAKENGVKKLILNHFDASKYTSLDIRKEAEKAAQQIFPDTTCATDDLIVTL